MAQPSMPLEWRIGLGEKTTEASGGSIGDELVYATSGLTSQTNPLARPQVLKGAVVRKEIDGAEEGLRNRTNGE